MPKLSVNFFDRDFTAKAGIPHEAEVERYSWNMLGGPDKAYLTAPYTGDAWDWCKFLRCPVQIWAGDEKQPWWGYVNRVVIPCGGTMIGVGLDEMFNYVITNWSLGDTNGETSDASDSMSIGEYGTKEKQLNLSNTSAAQAAQARDIFLADHSRAMAESEYSGGREYVSIECYGWYSTLGWRYYTNAGTSNVEDTAQIDTIVTAAGQFFRGTNIENTSGITSSEERDGKSTALSCINELLEAGTTNIRPLLAKVDKDRYLHVYERPREPRTETAPYLMQDDGTLQNQYGARVPPEWCTCAAWVQVRGLMSNLPGLSAMRPFFIESAEYNARQDRTTYRFAGAFEQRRLEKYVKEPGGGGKTPYEPYIEPPVGGGGGGVTAYLNLWCSKDEVILEQGTLSYYASFTSSQPYFEFTAAEEGLYLFTASANGSTTANTPASVSITYSASGANTRPSFGEAITGINEFGQSASMQAYMQIGETVEISGSAGGAAYVLVLSVTQFALVA